MGGSFGKDIDRILTNAGVVSFTDSWSSREGYKKRMKADIKAFVKDLKDDQLFSYIPERSHVGMENFTYERRIKNPLKMAKKMRALSENLGDWDVFCGLKPVI